MLYWHKQLFSKTMKTNQASLSRLCLERLARAASQRSASKKIQETTNNEAQKLVSMIK